MTSRSWLVVERLFDRRRGRAEEGPSMRFALGGRATDTASDSASFATRARDDRDVVVDFRCSTGIPARRRAVLDLWRLPSSFPHGEYFS